MQQSIISVFEEPEKDFFGSHWAYTEKGNIISSKRERSFLGNFFVIWEFLSQIYSLVLRKQFAKTLFVVNAKWDLRAHRGPCCKRKYPQIISREKLTERLLSDVWLHNTEFHPSLLGTFCWLCCLVFCKVIFRSALKAMEKKKYLQIKTGKKPSEKLHFDLWIQLPDLPISLQCSVC